MSDSLQPHGLWPVRLFSLWDSPGKNSGVGCHALLQGIFPTQGLNPCLPHCRRILYCLSYQGSPWLSLLHHKNLSSQPHYSHQHINIYFTCEKNKIFDYTYPSTNPPSPPYFLVPFPTNLLSIFVQTYYFHFFSHYFINPLLRLYLHLSVTSHLHVANFSG